jgi:Domain of unknown function (DUF5666)
MKAILIAAVAVVAVAVPAQANASRINGVVVAKQAQRGTFVIAGSRGEGTTVRASRARVRAGDRLEVRGQRLRDGTMLAARLTVRSHTQRAVVRGVVVRRLKRAALLATGRSVIDVRLGTVSPSLLVGRTVTFRVRIDDHGDLVAQGAAQSSSNPAAVEVEGRLVSVSPFVISIEGLPITITVPAGTTLPSGLAPGEEIELTVQVAANNVFTLVSIDEIENALPQVGEEVEVKGSVVASSASQLMVLSHGITFTLDAPANVTLPTIPLGTFVEARGIVATNGHFTLLRVRVEDGGGDGGGDDGGGGHGH